MLSSLRLDLTKLPFSITILSSELEKKLKLHDELLLQLLAKAPPEIINSWLMSRGEIPIFFTYIGRYRYIPYMPINVDEICLNLLRDYFNRYISQNYDRLVELAKKYEEVTGRPLLVYNLASNSIEAPAYAYLTDVEHLPNISNIFKQELEKIVETCPSQHRPEIGDLYFTFLPTTISYINYNGINIPIIVEGHSPIEAETARIDTSTHIIKHLEPTLVINIGSSKNIDEIIKNVLHKLINEYYIKFNQPLIEVLKEYSKFINQYENRIMDRALLELYSSALRFKLRFKPENQLVKEAYLRVTSSSRLSGDFDSSIYFTIVPSSRIAVALPLTPRNKLLEPYLTKMSKRLIEIFMPEVTCLAPNLFNLLSKLADLERKGFENFIDVLSLDVLPEDKHFRSIWNVGLIYMYNELQLYLPTEVADRAVRLLEQLYEQAKIKPIKPENSNLTTLIDVERPETSLVEEPVIILLMCNDVQELLNKLESLVEKLRSRELTLKKEIIIL